MGATLAETTFQITLGTRLYWFHELRHALYPVSSLPSLSPAKSLDSSMRAWPLCPLLIHALSIARPHVSQPAARILRIVLLCLLRLPHPSGGGEMRMDFFGMILLLPD